MNLPLNGRVAIIDDQLSQVEPLMKIFSQKQIPFTYFSGEVLFLPEEGISNNDIRVLFLDINLIDNTERNDKELKANLVPVLTRVISANNYPYVIIYWSRHERHKSLIENIFENELSDRKPICYLSAIKSDFFNLDGSMTDDFDTKIETLFTSIDALIEQSPAYSYLLHWENQVHSSTDKVLQEVFSSYHQFKDWTNNANYILEKLGNAYFGKHYKESSPEEKIKASFISFNSVFKDTLEHSVYNSTIPNIQNLTYDPAKVESKVSSINQKLNLSKDVNHIAESGNILVLENADEKKFGSLLIKLLSKIQFCNYLRQEQKNINEVELYRLANNELKKIKAEIKASWIKIAIVVTPICDYVQKSNKIYDRIVKGLLIPSQYKIFIDEKSEAVYVLPITIKYAGTEYVLILDFRYFATTDLSAENVTPIFRLRQELLAEIQSRLARHINRQGILFLDERE
ncbi:MAG: hypothetical protein IPH98_11020 [Saprospiraceae bacterium]|nr:hypothetical protein [Candidatus Defluviibacterium haderslevense]